MKNKKKYIILCISILLLTNIYQLYTKIHYIYPEKTTLDKIISSHCSKENINEIYIERLDSGNKKSIKDKDTINKVLSNLSNVQLVKYSGHMPHHKTEYSYEICIYDTKKNLFIDTRGKEYFIISDDGNLLKRYKVLIDSFDYEYMDEILYT